MSLKWAWLKIQKNQTFRILYKIKENNDSQQLHMFMCVCQIQIKIQYAEQQKQKQKKSTPASAYFESQNPFP